MTTAAERARATARVNGHSALPGHSVIDPKHTSVGNTVGTSVVITMSDVAPETIRWLWRGWLARALLNLLDGDPGVGKSTITLDITARVTRGEPMPLDSVRQDPVDVLLMAGEDHIAATMQPRLVAAGADLKRVHIVVCVPHLGDPDAPPTLGDTGAIERIVVEKKIGLIIIDPLMAHLPSGTDAYRDSEMRGLLGPWAAMAQRTGVAIILVRHLRKMGGSAVYRGGGTIGVIGAARSAMLVGRDPEDPTTCVLAHSKGNLAPPPQSLRYRIVDSDGVGRIEWLGVADGVTADHLAALPDPRSGKDEIDPVDAATDALRELLSAGPRPTKDVTAAVREMTGASHRTIERARARLGVQASKESGKSARVAVWMLSLPSGGVESGQDRLEDLGGGGVEPDPGKSSKYIDSLHTATASNSSGGVDGGGLENLHTAATGSQTVWSSAVWSGAQHRGLHEDTE